MNNIVWTKHAEERNKQRQITQGWIEATINNPDNFSEIEGGKIKCIKNFEKHTVTVITTKSDSGKYLILSAWVNPPILGTSDYKKENYNKNIKKVTGVKKIWITLLNQLGF
jgi:hypothetical protein